MKNAIIITLVFAIPLIGFSQRAEFQRYPNGLIYPDSAVTQLRGIVDSLNTHFNTCEEKRTYYPVFQARAHFISLDTGNVLQAKLDICSGISLQAFLKKYPEASVDSNQLVSKNVSLTMDQTPMEHYYSILPGNSSGEIDVARVKNNYNGIIGSWGFSYYPKEGYRENASLDAFYFIDTLPSNPLIEKYARLVQYTDCMVDTSTLVYYVNSFSQREERNSSVHQFMGCISKTTKIPIAFLRINNGSALETLDISSIDNLMQTNNTMYPLLEKAIKEALEKGGSNDLFEWCVGRYYSKATELELKRHRRVTGGCSQDPSPRVHAMEIARLSGETVNRKIFLRAHLDIMTDNFERMSDGSYAQAGRKTYIKELEVLNIEVPDLLLGVCLLVDNAPANHYFGSVGRIGRALAESKDSTEITGRILTMIADDQLDDYNRLRMYYLFKNYNYYVTDKEKQNENLKKLMAAKQTLPFYLQEKDGDDE